MQNIYLIALGGNRPHHRHGTPPNVLKAAIGALEDVGRVRKVARILGSAPMGPSHRRYANGAVMLDSEHAPRALLSRLQDIERDFGIRRGQRWGARTLDLDIIMWSGGAYSDSDLVIPHASFRSREFVLRPLVDVAPDWVDPVTNLTLRQLLARLKKRSAIAAIGRQ